MSSSSCWRPTKPARSDGSARRAAAKGLPTPRWYGLGRGARLRPCRAGGIPLELLGTFETIAEIAIALTGFTGVVIALGRGQLSDWSPTERFLLTALLYWSIGTMFLAFVPSGLASLRSLTEPWRVAHGVFALFHAGVFTWYFQQAGRLAIPVTRSPENLAIVVVGFGVLLAEVLVALGLLAGLAPFLYLVALLWFVFLAIRVFVALVFPRAPVEP